VAAAIVALVIVVLVLSSGSKALTKEEFIQKGDAICAAEDPKIGSALDPLPDPPTQENLPQFVQGLNVALPLLQSELTELRRLEPPKADQAIINASLDDFGRGVQRMGEALRAAEARDLNGFNTAIQDATRLFDSAGGKARDYGFQECGKQG